MPIVFFIDRDADDTDVLDVVDESMKYDVAKEYSTWSCGGVLLGWLLIKLCGKTGRGGRTGRAKSARNTGRNAQRYVNQRQSKLRYS